MNILIETTPSFRLGITWVSSHDEKPKRYTTPFEMLTVRIPFLTINFVSEKHCGFIRDVFHCGLKNNFPKDSEEFERVVEQEVRKSDIRIENSYSQSLSEYKAENLRLYNKVHELKGEKEALLRTIKIVGEQDAE